MRGLICQSSSIRDVSSSIATPRLSRRRSATRRRRSLLLRQCRCHLRRSRFRHSRRVQRRGRRARCQGSLRLMAGFRRLPLSPGSVDGRRTGLPGSNPVARVALRCAQRCGQGRRALTCHCLSVQPRPPLDGFKRHGFSEEDMVDYTPETEAQKAAAEAATTAQMAALFAPLSADPTRGGRRWRGCPRRRPRSAAPRKWSYGRIVGLVTSSAPAVIPGPRRRQLRRRSSSTTV